MDNKQTPKQQNSKKLTEAEKQQISKELEKKQLKINNRQFITK